MNLIKYIRKISGSGSRLRLSVLCLGLLAFSAVMSCPVFQPSAHAVAAASCKVDLDGDRDVDGLDLAGFVNDFDEACLADVAAKFGRTDVAPPAHVYKLNDTGIKKYGDATRNDLITPPEGFPGQDADFGRDVTDNDDTDGHAGFSYTKIGANGEVLPVVAANWAAVLDNVTGLMWEMKTDDGGLHDKDWKYSWYNPDMTNNGGSPGTLNGGSCGGTISSADTYNFVLAVNAENFCGHSDWRMPTLQELGAIVDMGRYSPAIDPLFFPDTVSSYYWSSSPYVEDCGLVWCVVFNRGVDEKNFKDDYASVRLVRSGQ